jgi:hypothetical protein
MRSRLELADALARDAQHVADVGRVAVAPLSPRGA